MTLPPDSGIFTQMLNVKKMSWVTWGSLVIVAFSAGAIIRPHLTSLDIPYGDSFNFTSRAIQMHGFLHSGQWGAFWEMLNAPLTFTLLPNYVLFWLVPTEWATGMTYGIIHTVIWHVLLWLGAWGLLRELGLVRLLPAVLLLVLANNNALDCTLYYYMDMSFSACSLVVLWLLTRVLMRQTRNAALAAGVGAGALLFVRPASGFAFLPCYAVAVAAFVGLRFSTFPSTQWRRWIYRILCGATLWLAAFLPVFALACGWTLIPTVVDHIVAQPGDYWAAGWETSQNPILHLLYFPLCLSYFYSVVAMGVCVVVTGLVSQLLPAMKRDLPIPSDDLKRCVLTGLVVGFVMFFGLFFSFVMHQKIIRGLTLMVPVLWIGTLGWMAIHWRLSRYITLFAVLYFLLAHAQFIWGVAGTKQNRDTQGYALNGDWLTRLPMQAPSLEEGPKITRSLLNMLAQCGVNEGRVAVGTEMLYWNECSLNWIAQFPYWQEGQKPPLSFTTLVDHQGNPMISRFAGASAFLLIVHPAVQYSREVYEANVRTAQYAMQKWTGSAARRVTTFTMGDSKPAVVVVAFKPFLTDSVQDTYLHDNFPPNHRAEQTEGEIFFLEHRLPWKEYWRIIRESREGLKVNVIRPGKK